METRTSHSSPCFFRVADASAASRASKMTSLSTPFSFETASTTIKISLFTRLHPTTHTKMALGSYGLPGEVRLRDLLQVPLHLLLIHFQLDPRGGGRLQQAGVPPAPRAGRLQLNKHP